MDFKGLLLLGAGAIAFVFVLIALNNFVGSSPMLMFVGTPAIIGIGAILGGGLFTYYMYHQVKWLNQNLFLIQGRYISIGKLGDPESHPDKFGENRFFSGLIA